MASQDKKSDRFCVIGAGPSGLAAAKNLKLAGIPFDCFESTNDIGGIWNPGNPACAYDTVHLNISKKFMKFLDHGIPSEYPDFLGRDQAFNYLKSYTERFNLYDDIKLNTPVRKVTKNGGIWHVWIGDEQEPRLYRGLVIANGHHTQPTKPDVPGSFDGEVLHSNDYKGPEQFKDKKVLVVGAGNSGLDLSCDAALYGGESFHSLRRGYHIIPKVIFGRPTDVVFEKLKRLKLPKWMVRSVAAMVMKTIIGPYEKYGLPKPDGEFFEHHPTCSSRYLDLLRHGSINIRPDVKNVEGHTVTFEDGRTQDVDMIVYATGYKVSLPFFDDKISDDLLDLKNLFINLFHRNDDSLFFVGLFQPADGGFWQLADYQSRLMTRFIQACDDDEKCAENFRKVKAKDFYDIGHGNKYVESDRHKYEVDHYRYRQVVAKLMKIFPSRPEKTVTSQSTHEVKQSSSQVA